MRLIQRLVKWCLAIFVVMAATGLAVVASGEVYYLLHFGFNQPFRWQQFANPPSETIEVLGYRHPKIIVQTASGDLFSCDTNSEQCAGIALQAFPAPSTGAIDLRCELNRFLPVPQLPERMLDLKEYAFCWSDGITYHKFAVTSDGNIWTARSSWSWSDQLLRLLFIALSGIVTLVFTLILILKRIRRRN